MPTTFDTVVVGLGAMGSAAAYVLAQRGQRVLGIERYTPAHDRGSSHGRSRIIRQAYYEHPDYVPLLLRAYELWARLAHESGQPLLTRTGGLMIGAQDSGVVTGSIRSAQQHGLPHEILDAAEIQRRYPPFTPGDATIALYEPDAGMLDPEACIRAFQGRAQQLGATLHFEETVQGWQADASGGGVRVQTSRGSYAAERLILAPGAWAPELLADLDLPLQVERKVLYWFEPHGGAAPFQPDRFPVYIWELNPGMTIYGFPAQEGAPGGVKVAFHHCDDHRLCTPATIQRDVADAEVEQMRAALAGHIPALAGELRATATCMYTNTPDLHFLLGLHPRHPQVLLASPCSGHGFKFASVIGEILADLAQDGRSALPIGLFDVARFSH